jgi:hypothetical protein
MKAGRGLYHPITTHEHTPLKSALLLQISRKTRPRTMQPAEQKAAGAVVLAQQSASFHGRGEEWPSSSSSATCYGRGSGRSSSYSLASGTRATGEPVRTPSPP